MHVQVPNVRCPVLMTPLCLEWHLFFRTSTFHRHLQVIQLPIEGQNATTGTRRKVDALLQQRRMDTVRSQFWVLLEALHRIHGSEICFEGAPFTRMRFILQTGELFFHPPSERAMHGLSRGARYSAIERGIQPSACN